MVRILTPTFFNRPADVVARELLGMYLVRRIDGTLVAHRIIETEAYVGPHDLANHAARGRTERTAVMFGPPGRWYVYLVYGMHWMLNIVTGPRGYPAAVLIRGVEEIVGPGRITKRLSITGDLTGAKATRASGLWLEDRGEPATPRNVRRTARIGVEYAGTVWAAKKLRFVLKQSRDLPRGRRRSITV